MAYLLCIYQYLNDLMFQIQLEPLCLAKINPLVCVLHILLGVIKMVFSSHKTIFAIILRPLFYTMRHSADC